MWSLRSLASSVSLKGAASTTWVCVFSAQCYMFETRASRKQNICWIWRRERGLLNHLCSHRGKVYHILDLPEFCCFSFLSIKRWFELFRMSQAFHGEVHGSDHCSGSSKSWVKTQQCALHRLIAVSGSWKRGDAGSGLKDPWGSS